MFAFVTITENNLKRKTKYDPFEIPQQKMRTLYTTVYNPKQITQSQKLAVVNLIKVKFNFVFNVHKCILLRA